jgi:hypothetical protein
VLQSRRHATCIVKLMQTPSRRACSHWAAHRWVARSCRSSMPFPCKLWVTSPPLALQANDTDHNDASVCWSYHQGPLLGAETGVIGFGATGLSRGGSGNVPVLGVSYNQVSPRGMA